MARRPSAALHAEGAGGGERHGGGGADTTDIRRLKTGGILTLPYKLGIYTIGVQQILDTSLALNRNLN